MSSKKPYNFNLSITHIAGRTAYFKGDNIMEGAYVKKENGIPESSYKTFGEVSQKQFLEIIDFVEEVGANL